VTTLRARLRLGRRVTIVVAVLAGASPDATSFDKQAFASANASTTRLRGTRIDCQIRDFMIRDREMIIERHSSPWRRENLLLLGCNPSGQSRLHIERRQLN